jgi:hypothetical protein
MRNVISIIAPIIIGISIFLIQQLEKTEPLIITTIGKSMCVILFFSTLPFLVSQEVFPLAFGISFIFVETVTFVGSKVVPYTDLTYILIEMASIIFSMVGFAFDKKYRDDGLAQKGYLMYMAFKYKQ